MILGEIPSESVPNFRAIDANAGKEHPHNLLFFDTETETTWVGDDQYLHLQFGVAERLTHNRGKWGKATEYLFHTRDEFWDIVEANTRPKSKLWVMAHNLGGFDFSVMGGIHPLLKRGWTIEKLIIECPPFVVDFVRDGARIRLIDSLNYVRASLADMGQAIGIPKGVDPGGEIDERLDYCRNDVRILRTFMLAWMAFVAEHDLGNFAITAAAQAMNAWRHRFAPKYTDRNGKEKVKVFPTSGPDYEPLERRGYFAGRVGAEFIGHHQGHVLCYDVNSLFPAVMKSKRYPYALKAAGDTLPLEHASLLLARGYGFIADVDLDVPEGCDWYPWRGERVTFPVGRFSTTLCTGELQLALEHGHVVRIGRWQQYRMADLFSSYVDYFYDLRQRFKVNGETLWAFICKIFLNSLYGKFGQKIPQWEEVEDPSVFPTCGPRGEMLTSPMMTMDGVLFRKVGDLVERRLDEDRGKARNAFIAIAAHVTSYARLALLEGLQTAGREHVLYYDTDSLFADEEGRKALDEAGALDNDTIGLWKLEAEADSIEIRGPKDYTFGGVVKIKGVRKNAEQLAENVFRQEKFHSFKGSVFHNRMGEMLITLETKHLSRKYTKGVVLPDGSVRPFRFPEEEPERGPP